MKRKVGKTKMDIVDKKGHKLYQTYTRSMANTSVYRINYLYCYKCDKFFKLKDGIIKVKLQ